MVLVYVSFFLLIENEKAEKVEQKEHKTTSATASDILADVVGESGKIKIHFKVPKTICWIFRKFIRW